MTLLIYYIVISLALDAVAIGLCLWIETMFPWASMPIFLTLYFLILWVAWIISVKITAPKSAPAIGATSDQRA